MISAFILILKKDSAKTVMLMCTAFLMLDVQVALNTTSASPESRTPRRRSPTAGSRRRSRCWAGMATWTLPGPRGHVQGMFNLLVSPCCNFCLFARVSWPIVVNQKGKATIPSFAACEFRVIYYSYFGPMQGREQFHAHDEWGLSVSQHFHQESDQA